MTTLAEEHRNLKRFSLAKSSPLAADGNEAKIEDQESNTGSVRIKAVPLGTAKRTERYSFLIKVERPPISAIDDSPALMDEAAARLLAISPDTSKKWRQRGIGPNYIQYGSDGPVRYMLDDLMSFRAIHKITTRPMPENN